MYKQAIELSPNERYQTVPDHRNKYEVAKNMRDIEKRQPNTDYRINGKSWKTRMAQREQWRKRNAVNQKKSDIIKKAAVYIYRIKQAGAIEDKANELLKGYRWGVTLPDGTYKIAPTTQEQEAMDWSDWRSFRDAPKGSMKDKKTGNCIDFSDYVLKNIPGSSCVLRADSENPEAFHVTPIIKTDDGKYTYLRQFYGNDNYVSKNKANTIEDLIAKMPIPKKAFDGEVFNYYPLTVIPEHANLEELLENTKAVSKPIAIKCVKRRGKNTVQKLK